MKYKTFSDDSCCQVLKTIAVCLGSSHLSLQYLCFFKFKNTSIPHIPSFNYQASFTVLHNVVIPNSSQIVPASLILKEFELFLKK